MPVLRVLKVLLALPDLLVRKELPEKPVPSDPRALPVLPVLRVLKVLRVLPDLLARKVLLEKPDPLVPKDLRVLPVPLA